jgi:hypothetical protein
MNGEQRHAHTLTRALHYQNKVAAKKDGTTKAAIFSFRGLALNPVNLTANGLQPAPSPDKAVLSLAVKVPKGGKWKAASSLLFPIQGECTLRLNQTQTFLLLAHPDLGTLNFMTADTDAFPYAVLYSGPDQESPTLLAPNTGLTFVGAKATLKFGKNKAIKLSTESPTFQLATTGAATTGEYLPGPVKTHN